MNSASTVLRNMPIFKALSDNQFKGLIAQSKSLFLARDQVIFRKDDISTHFYYVAAGRIKVFRNSPQGGEKIIGILQTEQMFAEATMFLSQRKYPASASALEESEVICFPNEVMMGFLDNSMELSRAMLGNLSKKLHTQIIEIDYLSLQNATFRFLYFIDSIMVVTKDGGADVELPAAKHAIASRLSITPETLSRTLHELNKKNIVKPNGKGKSLRIPSVQVLKEYLIGFGA